MWNPNGEVGQNCSGLHLFPAQVIGGYSVEWRRLLTLSSTRAALQLCLEHVLKDVSGPIPGGIRLGYVWVCSRRSRQFFVWLLCILKAA